MAADIRRHWFTVYVSRVFTVIGCAAKRAEESRGLFGFHDFRRCPDCQRIDQGFECWGDNGHLQASPKTREQLIHWIKTYARKRLPAADSFGPGHYLGFRFRRESDIHYKGN